MNKNCLIVANWKCNKSSVEATQFIDELKIALNDAKTENTVVICPSNVVLERVAQEAMGTQIKVGCQNFLNYEGGAFTGETCLQQIMGLNVEYCLVGHSERRKYFLEDDEIVNFKTREALLSDFIPIVCVGESLEEREADKTVDVISAQVRGAMQDISPELAGNIVWAYEPIWAIGTGKVANPDDADKVCHLIKQVVNELTGIDITEIKVLYGGSVNQHNYTNFVSSMSIDGVLIGGASLDIEQFKIMATKRIVRLKSIQDQPTKRLAIRE